MSWYRDAESQLVQVASAIQGQHPLHLEPLTASAVELVHSLKKNDGLIVEALSSPSGSPLITNLLNVAILGTKMGMGLGYYGTELERLALAGLVHDVGLLAVPPAVVGKTGRLTRDERMLIEQHPELGYQVIHDAGPQHQWLAQVVRQAHERWNGQGYPHRLNGRQIGEMAQIIGVVDVFDALVSERPYRRRLLPHQAVKELLVAERTAFPREVMKALVEQLSVYPLGTTVRLTTGEVGTVVRVNNRYPLRPIVRVVEREGERELGARQVDLSLTPLVSIIDTLDPPMVGRVSFADAPDVSRDAAPGVVASDHFTALLESLDAIATAIQGVVETRIPAQHRPDHRDTAGFAAPAESSGRIDHTFRDEIVGLFALEAREWLAQIQTALLKLASGLDTTVRSKVYGVMLSGITNLAKSASTVDLGDIETMASNLLPLLREVGGGTVQPNSEALRSLQAGLDRITAAVQLLARDHPEEDSQRVAAPQPAGDMNEHHQADAGVRSHTTGTDRGHASMPLLNALRELQQVRARSMQPPRDVLEAVIQRAEQEGGGHLERVDVGMIGHILRELDRLDEEFLREVRDRVPAMTGVLLRLREHAPLDFVTASQLDPVLEHVDALSGLAKSLQADTIMMFLQGVKAFLATTAYHKVATLPQRLEAIEDRLHALVPIAEQWVTLGRLERTAIEEILPS